MRPVRWKEGKNSGLGPETSSSRTAVAVTAQTAMTATEPRCRLTRFIVLVLPLTETPVSAGIEGDTIASSIATQDAPPLRHLRLTKPDFIPQESARPQDSF